jgi:hypothetical protein
MSWGFCRFFGFLVFWWSDSSRDLNLALKWRNTVKQSFINFTEQIWGTSLRRDRDFSKFGIYPLASLVDTPWLEAMHEVLQFVKHYHHTKFQVNISNRSWVLEAIPPNLHDCTRPCRLMCDDDLRSIKIRNATLHFFLNSCKFSAIVILDFLAYF